MVLSIKNPVADELARRRRVARGLDDIVERFNKLPALDQRSSEEIIGYDQHGLPS